MTKQQRIHVQAFSFKDLCKFVDNYSKQGYTVVDSDKLSEAPQHTGRIYSCWMTPESQEVVVEEKVEEEPEPETPVDDVQKAEQWESEEHVIVSPDFDSMTKKELEAYAKEKYGVDLDRRMSKTKLIAEIKNLS